MPQGRGVNGLDPISEAAGKMDLVAVLPIYGVLAR
jgi:hypothetical protein